MKPHLSTIPLILLLAANPLLAENDFPLRWQESGLGDKTTGYRPHLLNLDDKAPAGLKHAPDGLHAPRYASFTLGPKDAPATVCVILDETDGRPSRLYVDGNANGDLADYPALAWKTSPSQDPDGADAITYTTHTTVNIPFASGAKKGRITFSQTRSQTKYDAMFRKSITYYSDYGWVGEINLGGKTIPAALPDSGGMGDFRFDDSVTLTPLLWLGIPSGPKNRIGASFVASKPFELDGKWWAIKDLTPDGHFSIAESTKPANAKPDKPFVKQSGPDLNPGKKAPAFTGKLLGGKETKFPDDYKGKIVMLDFWATWCGPCIREIPNVVAAYQKFHDQGFEVLGISLDKEGAEKLLGDFTKAKAMPWPQVYDGKFWNAAVSTLYGIHAVPYMILIDGDTGLVIESDLAGAELSKIIEKALAARKK